MSANQSRSHDHERQEEDQESETLGSSVVKGEVGGGARVKKAGKST